MQSDEPNGKSRIKQYQRQTKQNLQTTDNNLYRKVETKIMQACSKRHKKNGVDETTKTSLIRLQKKRGNLNSRTRANHHLG